MIYTFCRSVVRIIACLFYRHKTYGKEHIPPGGVLIASNHCSFLDPPLVGASCSDQIHYLARDTLYKFSPFGWLLRQLNTHPVSRGKGNLGTLKMTMDLIKNGNKVVIFPEGKRSSTGDLQPGQLGIGMLVQRTGCKILPAYVHGTYDVWNNTRKFPKIFGQTACVFGTPIEYAACAAEDKKEAQAACVQQIMDKIKELRSWYLAGAQGTPP